MALKGNTINVDILPIVNKQADEAERLLPISSDLRNGYVTPMQNWGKRPGYFELLSLPGEEPVPVTPPGVVPISPIPFTAYCLGNCPPDTAPGAQTLSTSTCWDYQSGEPAGTLTANVAGGFNYLEGSDPTFYVSVANRDAFGTDYETNTCVGGPLVGTSPMFQILKYVGAVVTVETPVPLLNAADTLRIVTQSAQFGQQGKADVHCYHISGNYKSGAGSFFPVNALFNITDQTIAYFTLISSARARGYWTKYGDYYFLASGTPPYGIDKYQVSTGIISPSGATSNPAIWSQRGPITAAGNRLYYGIQATADYLYVWDYNLPDGSVIYRLDHDGTEIQSWTLDLTTLMGGAPVPFGFEIAQIEVVSDDLIYIVYGNPTAFYFVYLDTVSGTLTFVGDTTTISGRTAGCTGLNPDYTELGDSAFRFNQGLLYVSAGGAGFGLTNVESFGTLLCPPGLTVPIGS